MASIVGKRRGKHTYYYLVESARVGGKPRIVSQQYLGTAEELTERLSGPGPGEPDRSAHRRFGDLAATLSVIERLGVARIVDEVAPRRAGALASVGTYIALASANRVVAPCSKLAFEDWWATTAGPRMLRLPAGALDHRRFWDAMDALSPEHLVEAEARVVESAVANFGLDLSALVLDMTNFATFIDSGNARNTIAKRGHAKQKRHDLRLLGLGLVVTSDGSVPVVSHPYPGNRPDVTQFGAVVTELVGRWRHLAGEGDEITLTFDAGNDSGDNLALIEGSPLHFVGSLPPAQHPDLLAIEAARYAPVDQERFPGLTYVEARAQAMGTEYRVVVTHSPTFHERQARGFAQTLAKATGALSALAARLERGKTRRGREAVETEVRAVLSARWLERVVRWHLAGQKPARLRLRFEVDEEARAALEAEYFGKRILFTDRQDWPVTEVVAAYRAQADVEAGFRQLKDRKVVSFSPMFHWTDQKVLVHAFYCVVALLVAHLMRREAARAGLDMSVRVLLRALSGIEETVLLYPGERGRPRARRMLTEMDPTEERLFELFGLERYAPRR